MNFDMCFASRLIRKTCLFLYVDFARKHWNHTANHATTNLPLHWQAAVDSFTRLIDKSMSKRIILCSSNNS